jgi:hypothetical protein
LQVQLPDVTENKPVDQNKGGPAGKKEGADFVAKNCPGEKEWNKRSFEIESLRNGREQTAKYSNTKSPKASSIRYTPQRAGPAGNLSACTSERVSPAPSNPTS